MELEATGSDREAILLGYHSQTLKRSEELFSREAKRLGLTDDTGEGHQRAATRGRVDRPSDDADEGKPMVSMFSSMAGAGHPRAVG